MYLNILHAELQQDTVEIKYVMQGKLIQAARAIVGHQQPHVPLQTIGTVMIKQVVQALVQSGVLALAAREVIVQVQHPLVHPTHVTNPIHGIAK